MFVLPRQVGDGFLTHAGSPTLENPASGAPNEARPFGTPAALLASLAVLSQDVQPLVDSTNNCFVWPTSWSTQLVFQMSLGNGTYGGVQICLAVSWLGSRAPRRHLGTTIRCHSQDPVPVQPVLTVPHRHLGAAVRRQCSSGSRCSGLL